MEQAHPIWLVTNADAGSNDAASVEAVREALAHAHMPVARTVCFPDEELPTIAALDEAAITTVAIYTGDGSINALIGQLAGWSGQVLVLPGGTMNLLSERLHGDAGAEEIVARIAAGTSRRERPLCIDSGFGIALSGVLVGPGTRWNLVREAMRAVDPVAMAQGVVDAVDSSANAPRVFCRDPALGRAEGYALILLSPEAGGMVVQAFYADTALEFAQQGLAIAKRNFREGPHDRLGQVDAIVLAHRSSEPLGVLVDGEPHESDDEVRFEVAPAPVDLVATAPS